MAPAVSQATRLSTNVNEQANNVGLDGPAKTRQMGLWCKPGPGCEASRELGDGSANIGCDGLHAMLSPRWQFALRWKANRY